jgi:hypothetical protein
MLLAAVFVTIMPVVSANSATRVTAISQTTNTYTPAPNIGANGRFNMAVSNIEAVVNHYSPYLRSFGITFGYGLFVFIVLCLFVYVVRRDFMFLLFSLSVLV